MPRRSDRRAWTRSVHTHRSDVGQALLRFSRSNNSGPRVFARGELYQTYVNIKERRDGKIGRNAERAFMETIEELITRELLYRHKEDELSISDILRSKFRCLRREIRISDLPPHLIQLETAKKLNQIMGPQNMLTKYHLNRLCNDYLGHGRVLEYADSDSDHRPRHRAPALQAWRSTSTVDGLEAWGEERSRALQSDDEDEDEDEEQEEEEEEEGPDMDMDDDREQGGEDRNRLLQVVGSPFRSPTRPPPNPTQSYPTPSSAPRLLTHSRTRDVDVPPTPTPVGRPGRDESKILGANGVDDDDEAEGRDRDRGEGPSRVRMVRRIDWGQGGEEGLEHMHQCGYRHELEDLRTKFSKKSHGEKALRSEHEALSALHGTILTQRDALSRERDAIKDDRDAVVLERNYIVRERDALQARNGVLEGENAILVGEKERLEVEKSECVDEVGKLCEQLVLLQRDLDELREEKVRWEEERVRDGVRRGGLEEQIRRLEQQVAIAEHRNLELEGEYNRLKQGRQADMLYILQLQQEIKESRAALDTLQTDFQTLKHTHEAIQQDLTSARDLLRLRSDELAQVNAQLQRTTYELGQVQEELRSFHRIRQISEDNLRKEIENHQCTKQMLEQERRELNAIIGEKESLLRECQEGLAGYERRVLSMNAYRETCLPMISGYV